MKRTAFALLTFVLIVIALPACKKTSSANNETVLTVETTPANKSNNLNILGPDFPLKVEITSAMPASGVKIEITVSKEGSPDPAFFSATNNTTAPQNNYTITNTPYGFTCIVNITVSSLSKPGNVWKGTYRYSRK